LDKKLCISALDNKVVCPVQTMYIYLQDRPKLHGQLFCHFYGTHFLFIFLYGTPSFAYVVAIPILKECDLQFAFFTPKTLSAFFNMAEN
jgi:hypothetical protein